jgi:hypothetical protein
MIFVAAAADVGDRQVPFLAFLRAARRDIEGMHVVAVAADGHQLGGIILVGLGVEGFPVGGDVVGDDAQARLFGSLAEFLGFFPEVEVALGAFGLLDARSISHAGVTLSVISRWHATHSILAVHALAVLVGDDGLDRALFAIRAEHLELALLAVVAGLAGSIVEFWSDDGCSRGAAWVTPGLTRVARNVTVARSDAASRVPSIMCLSLPVRVCRPCHGQQQKAIRSLEAPDMIQAISATGSTARGCSAPWDPWLR